MSATRVTNQMRQLRFGVEIEVAGINRTTLAFAVGEAVGGVVRRANGEVANRNSWAGDGFLVSGWSIVYDGSLNRDDSGEVVSPPLRYDQMDLVRDVVRQVREAGAVVTPRCGVHVHVDGGGFDEGSMKSLINLFSRTQNHIFAALQIDSGRQRRYARPMRRDLVERVNGNLELEEPKNLNEMNVCWYGQYEPAPRKYNRTRYQALNLNSFWLRGTIEFRMFNGSLHAGEIRSYIIFCIAMAAKSLVSNIQNREPKPYSDRTGWKEMGDFLNYLGLSGREFKTTRYHLLRHLYEAAGKQYPDPSVKKKTRRQRKKEKKRSQMNADPLLARSQRTVDRARARAAIRSEELINSVPVDSIRDDFYDLSLNIGTDGFLGSSDADTQ